jgi:hypothetical protein
MINNMLPSFKTKQDDLDTRKEKLLIKFVPFREGLIHGVELFIESALNIGLKNVNKLRRIKDEKDLIEAKFTLNDSDLVLISNNDIFKLDKINEDLAGKIFIYLLPGDENNTPILDVAFVESGKDDYRIWGQWFTQDGPHMLTGNIHVDEETVSKVASIIVNHFYRYEFSWRDQPTMKATLGTTVKRSIGFVKD